MRREIGAHHGWIVGATQPALAPATVNTKLEARIAAAAAKGTDTTAASAALAAMNTAVTATPGDVAGQRPPV